MTQQHSPLPWTRRMATTDTWFIDGPDGETIILVGRNRTEHTEPEPGVRIMREVLKPHADANAALFFAAPKLLAALQALMSNPHIDLGDFVYLIRERESLGWDGPSVKAWSDADVAARAAITEATTAIDGAEEAKAEQARRTAELDRLCGPAPVPELDVP